MRRAVKWFVPALALMSWGCPDPIEIPSLISEFSHAEASARAPCPHDWPRTLTFHRNSGIGGGTAGGGGGRGGGGAIPVQVEIGDTLSGPDSIADIVEFHDCQRFVDSGTNAYDSIFAVFAVMRLTRLDTLLAASRGQPATSGASVSLGGDDWLPAALVLAWNDYPALGIHVGFNCLYMSPSQAGAATWQAAMYAFGLLEPECSSAVSNVNAQAGQLPLAVPTASASGPVPRTVLAVADSQHQNLTSASDYPPVTRWEWDQVSGQYYIGLRCQVATWCEISSGNVTSAPTFASGLPSAPGTSDGGQLRVTQAKGWYDQQILAERDPLTGILRPSGFLGTLIPVPNLAQIESATFETDWTQVAWAALENVSGGQRLNPYAVKSNIHETARGASLDQLNKIFLCQGQTCQCPAGTSQCEAGASLGVTPCAKLNGTASDGTWWARIESPDGSSNKVLCVVRYAMADMSMPIPGTVRWRWLETDEEEWIRCPQGCCELLNGEG
jgi:hypothetical protein